MPIISVQQYNRVQTALGTDGGVYKPIMRDISGTDQAEVIGRNRL